MTHYVSDFAGGDRDHEDPLGGNGANLAEDCVSGARFRVPVARRTAGRASILSRADGRSDSR